MKKLTLLLVLLSVQALFAEDFKKAATSGFVFLEVPVTARAAALGETSIALSDMNSDAIFTNPAGLGFSNKEHSFSVSYATWFADIKHYAASYSWSSPIGVIALGAVVMDYGEMPRTSKQGQKVYMVEGQFSANDLAISAAISKKLTDKFSFGFTAKYAREKIDIYSASNVLFDGGFLYYTGFKSLRIAASIQNFGTEAKFLGDEFKMPAWLRIGAAAEVLGSFESDYRITTSAELVHASDNDERVNAGVEASWKNIITLRGGYKFNYDEETYSLGAGIKPPNIPASFDVAFADYGRLGNIFRFTIQYGML